MRRRTVIVAAGLVVVLGVGALGVVLLTGGEPRHRPNIVVIMTDDQTLESLRVMRRTERVLQEHGVTFDDMFTSYPLCCPSRTTYLTGQYAHNHHVLYNEGSTGGYELFFGQKRTVPRALQRVGYRTIHIGKYLNGYGLVHPKQIPPGWTDWNGSVDPSTYRYFGFTLNENGKLHTYGPTQYQTDVYTDMAVQKIEREAKKPGPFFLNLAYLAPHAVNGETSGLDFVDLAALGDPMKHHTIRHPVPAPRDRTRFHNEPLPNDPAFDEADVSDKPINIRKRPLFRRSRIKEIKRNYDLRLASLIDVDRGVLRVVRALKRTHQLNNTDIIFLSDNGFFHGEHRVAFGKYLPYEPSIRVPLIVRGPNFAENEHSDALVNNVDVPATILQIAGARPPRVLDGRSLVPLLRHPRRAHGHRAILLETGANDANAPVYSGLRTRRYKYLEYSTGERELYDLVNDPFELQNVAGDPRYRKIQARLAVQLASAEACRGRECP